MSLCLQEVHNIVIEGIRGEEITTAICRMNGNNY
jgi:hypothetical protein